MKPNLKPRHLRLVEQRKKEVLSSDGPKRMGWIAIEGSILIGDSSNFRQIAPCTTTIFDSPKLNKSNFNWTNETIQFSDGGVGAGLEIPVSSPDGMCPVHVEFDKTGKPIKLILTLPQ